MSLKGTRQLNDDIVPSLNGKRLLGTRQIIGPSDVEPLALGTKRANRFAIVDQPQHQIGKIQILSASNVGQNTRLVDVNAHTYMMDPLWLFPIARHSIPAVEPQPSQINFPPPLMCRDR